MIVVLGVGFFVVIAGVIFLANLGAKSIEAVHRQRDDDFDDFHRQLDRERVGRDRGFQARDVKIAVLEADIRAAQLVAASHANQLAEALAERDGIIRFLNEVPQNFNLHLPAETFAILLPDRMKLDLTSEG